MRWIAAAVAIATVALASAPAFAFSDEPAPSGPGVQSQFNDPDAAVDNLADSAQGGSGTAVSNGAQLPSSGQTLRSLTPPTSQDAEPVNPNWPAWMVWHQQ